MANNWITARRIFHRICIANKRSSVKWAWDQRKLIFKMISNHNRTGDFVIQWMWLFTHALYLSWYLNSLWPSDAIWRHRSGSTLAQIMACSLTAPNHYRNQFWLPISKGFLHSSESHFTATAHATILYHEFENRTCKLTSIFPRGQWVLMKEVPQRKHNVYLISLCRIALVIRQHLFL